MGGRFAQDSAPSSETKSSCVGNPFDDDKPVQSGLPTHVFREPLHAGSRAHFPAGLLAFLHQGKITVNHPRLIRSSAGIGMPMSTFDRDPAHPSAGL